MKNKIKRIPVKLLAVLLSVFNIKNAAVTGHYNFLKKENFYKIVIKNKKFLVEEKTNIEYIKENYYFIYEFIPEYIYKEYYNGLVHIRSADVLEQIYDKQPLYIMAREFLQLFRTTSLYEKANFAHLHQLRRGIAIVREISGEDTFMFWQNTVNKILLENNFHLGFCHGDFHALNIMHENGVKRLIDLDCVRIQSIQEFDAIYFIVQEIIYDEKNIWWHEALKILPQKLTSVEKYHNFLSEFVCLDKLNLLMPLYFLDRIGQDLLYCNSIDELGSEKLAIDIEYWKNFLMEHYNKC